MAATPTSCVDGGGSMSDAEGNDMRCRTVKGTRGSRLLGPVVAATCTDLGSRLCVVDGATRCTVVAWVV